MIWSDIACIVFACVSMNHLGLISAMESVIHRRLWIVDCVKCATFWAVLAYMLIFTGDVIMSLAISLFCAWLALWVELGMASIDNLYMKLYEKVITTSNNVAPAPDADDGNSAGSLSEL